MIQLDDNLSEPSFLKSVLSESRLDKRERGLAASLKRLALKAWKVVQERRSVQAALLLFSVLYVYFLFVLGRKCLRLGLKYLRQAKWSYE